MRLLVLLLVASGCRFVTTQTAQIARPRRDPDRIVLVVDAPATGRADGYHDAYVALEQRLVATLARDPHIEVKPTPPGVEACAVVESGAADAFVKLDVLPGSLAHYGFWEGLPHCSGSIFGGNGKGGGGGCSPRGPASWTSWVTVSLTLHAPVIRNGRPLRLCTATKTLATWRSPTIDGIDGWKSLVDAQLTRAGDWIEAHVAAKAFAVDTTVHASELAAGTNDGVHVGDMFRVNDSDAYAIATNVTPTTTQVEPLSDATLDGARVVDQRSPWALAIQPHAGVTRLDDTGITSTAALIGFDVRGTKLASGPIFGVGFDTVLGAHHDLMFAGPQIGWSMRMNPMLELHAIGELDGGIDTATRPDNTHALGGRGTAALGATLNTHSVFTSLEVGYAYSSMFDPVAHVAERGPFARLSFGFSSFH